MKNRFFLFFAILNFLILNELSAQEIEFSKEVFTYSNTTLPYRKAIISGNDDKASLVIYLHGGTSKGEDNETQMQEPGINAISTWLLENNHKAIMLVPQCPQDKSWIGTTQNIIVNLIKTYIKQGEVDDNKIYILGGSMGGTGTWNMLSNHPNLFAAAMPVAGNPTGLDAEAVSQTPTIIVMGTADKIMKISNVETFLAEMDKYNAEYKFDIEDGWTHEDVCKHSYTTERLDWLFKHIKGQESGINNIINQNNEVVKIIWFSINGQKLNSLPRQKGIYIKTFIYNNGSIVSEKYYTN